MLVNGSFSPGKNVAVVLNQITILEKQVIKKCVNNMIGVMSKKERQAGWKRDCKELETSWDSSWAALQRREVVSKQKAEQC